MPPLRIYVSVLALFLLPITASADDGCPDCRGLGFEVVYIGEPWRNESGGLRDGSTYIDNIEFVFTADRGSLGIPGLSARINVLRNNSNELSAEYVGDIQTVSGIDAPDAWRAYEAWMEWSPANDDRFSVRAGIYAADQEFDVAPTGGLFIHGVGGTGTDYALSGVNGPPIFPLSALGVRVRGSWGNAGYWQAAVLDGVPGDPDDPEEFDYSWSDGDGALLQTEVGIEDDAWNKLAIGVWTYSTEREKLRPGSDGLPETERWDTGLYAIADRHLASGEFGDLDAFLRVGATREELFSGGQVNVITAYIGGGLSWQGFWSARPDDTLGFLFGTAVAGDEFRRAQREMGLDPERHETALELTYRAQITDWFGLQPDIQYIINPGLDSDLDNAFVYGFRFDVVFGKTW